MQQTFSVMPPLPSRPEEIPGVFDWFARAREERPVVLDDRSGRRWWHVLRYEDVARVLTDHACFSNKVPDFEYIGLGDTLIVKDPPDHRKMRSLVNLAFTPRAVARLTDRVAAMTQELLDRVRAKGELDIVADIAAPLPSRVICEMLGVPESDWADIGTWTRFDASNRPTPLRDYFRALLEERRRSPREDLVSALSTAEIDGQRLSERELLQFCVLLFFAGQETTKNLIANFFLTLSEHPEDQARLTREPALIPTAIEEVLRFLPPVWFVMRRAAEDVEIGGVRIPAGGMVMPWMASANRDAAQFPDPTRFDVAREPNRHLGFGHGIHFCVGAPLTRLEAAVALPMMLEQLKGLRVRREQPIGIRAGIVFVIGRLPATFEARPWS
jgi:cytochrome P450 family 109